MRDNYSEMDKLGRYISCLNSQQSRVAECQRRVHDLIDLQLCSAGVEAAIKAHDYETGTVCTISRITSPFF